MKCSIFNIQHFKTIKRHHFAFAWQSGTCIISDYTVWMKDLSEKELFSVFLINLSITNSIGLLHNNTLCINHHHHYCVNILYLKSPNTWVVFECTCISMHVMRSCGVRVDRQIDGCCLNNGNNMWCLGLTHSFHLTGYRLIFFMWMLDTVLCSGAPRETSRDHVF